MMNIVLIGATSAIVHATARRFASRGANIYLVGRNQDALQIIRDDLLGRGAAEVHLDSIDFTNNDSVNALAKKSKQVLQEIDLVLIGHGTLPDQADCSDYAAFTRQFEINCLSVISFLTAFKPILKGQGHGMVAVIGSVAGDRGRKSNYAYGTSKGALELYLQGLRNEFFSEGVSVLLIKPGFVDTPMTEGIKKGLLFASPESVATDIEKAILKKKDLIYTPFFWRWIMLIIKSIPEAIFKRMNL